MYCFVFFRFFFVSVFFVETRRSNLSSSRKLKESTLGLNSIIGMIVAFCGLFPVIVREWQDFYWFFYDVFVLIILFVPWWMWMSVWTEGLELPRGNLRKGQKIHRLIMIMKNKCIMFCKRNWIFIVLFWILQLVRVLFTSVDGVIDWLNCFHAAICLFIYERKSYIIQLPNVHNKSISV